LLLREKSGDTSTNGMGAWWEAYQDMSADEKERAISLYNRQRAKSRRKATETAVDEKATSAQIEPLVKEQETRSRRTRNKSTSHTSSGDSRSRND
ncbi:MAG: polynucleotide adenylyltransferase PcnB, partial [Acinetobacter sp.]